MARTEIRPSANRNHRYRSGPVSETAGGATGNGRKSAAAAGHGHSPCKPAITERFDDLPFPRCDDCIAVLTRRVQAAASSAYRWLARAAGYLMQSQRARRRRLTSTFSPNQSTFTGESCYADTYVEHDYGCWNSGPAVSATGPTDHWRHCPDNVATNLRWYITALSDAGFEPDRRIYFGGRPCVIYVQLVSVAKSWRVIGFDVGPTR